jgi:hypothetical protein
VIVVAEHITVLLWPGRDQCFASFWNHFVSFMISSRDRFKDIPSDAIGNRDSVSTAVQIVKGLSL